MDLKYVNKGRKTEGSKRSLHNSLLEVALSILGKVIFNHFLDTSGELLPRDVEEFLRGRMPFLYYSTDEMLLDNEWEIVWEFPSNSPDEIQTKRRIEHIMHPYEFALFITSSIKMASLELVWSCHSSSSSLRKIGGGA